MGSPLAPVLADIFMAFYESKNLRAQTLRVLHHFHVRVV